ncbi:hypothetical protein SALBM135S_00575 [Streptomyces alboniger]
MAVGAAGRATPNTPGWAAVEAKNPVKDYMTAVLTGGYRSVRPGRRPTRSPRR